MIAICIESSHAKGMGHLFRGINLARCLTRHGRSYMILINDHAPSIRHLQQQRLAYKIVPLQADAKDWETQIIQANGIDVWINDRLDTSREHAERVKACQVALITFDDGGGGGALSDLHIAPLAACRPHRLAGKQLLTDLEYLILDPRLDDYRRQRVHMRKLLVSLGGSDTHGVAVRVVKALKELQLKATLHLGPAFEHQPALDRIVNDQFDMVASVPSMGALYAEHDLALTGGGITPFEAIATGLPCVVIANETFEIPTAQFLESKGLACFMGHWRELTNERLSAAITSACGQLKPMSVNGLDAISPGGAEKVYDVICRYI